MVLGVLFTLIASVFFNLSNLMEKRGVDRLAQISARRVVHMIRLLLSSRLWMAGFGFGVAAVLLMVIGYSITPIAVAQSIFGAGTVLIVIAARLYIRESLGRREYAGLGVMIVSVILVSFTLGSSTSPGVGGSVERTLFASVSTAAAAGLVLSGVHRLPGDPGVLFGVTSGLFYGVAALQAKSTAVILQHRGLLGGLPHALTSPYPYVFVVASVLGLLTFQMGLQRCRLALVVPVTNVVASVYVVAVGMVIFNESLPSNEVLASLRILGFALVLIATSIFATSTAASPARSRGANRGFQADSESVTGRSISATEQKRGGSLKLVSHRGKTSSHDELVVDE